jgi:hypothetical protein
MKRAQWGKMMLIIICLSTMQAVGAQDAWARGRKHKKWRRWERHPYHGRRVHLPDIFTQVIEVGHRKLYYYKGTFYKKRRGGYVVVHAPIGARVRRLPVGAKRVYMNGRRYYYYNGACYRRRGLRYEVVTDPLYEDFHFPPEVRFVDTHVYMEEEPFITGERYTIRILNERGRYTAVTIVHTDDGYLGPRGEFYAEFPDAKQLRMLYGK